MSTPTISSDALFDFDSNLNEGIAKKFPFLSSHADERVTDIINDAFNINVLSLDWYDDDYDEDYTRDEDIIATLTDKLQEVVSELRESDDYINQSVQWSHPMIYTQDYLEYYAENSCECDEAFYSCYGSVSEFSSINDAIAAAVCLHLENSLREELEELADWLEDEDPADYL